MELDELKQLVESNARAIFSHERRLGQLSAHSIIEGSERLELLQHLQGLKQQLKQFESDNTGELQT